MSRICPHDNLLWENLSTWKSVMWSNFSTWQICFPRVPPVVPVTNMRYALNKVYFVIKCVNLTTHFVVHYSPILDISLLWSLCLYLFDPHNKFPFNCWDQLTQRALLVSHSTDFYSGGVLSTYTNTDYRIVLSPLPLFSSSSFL